MFEYIVWICASMKVFLEPSCWKQADNVLCHWLWFCSIAGPFKITFYAVRLPTWPAQFQPNLDFKKSITHDKKKILNE